MSGGADPYPLPVPQLVGGAAAARPDPLGGAGILRQLLAAVVPSGLMFMLVCVSGSSPGPDPGPDLPSLISVTPKYIAIVY